MMIFILLENFKIKANKDALVEYERLKHFDLFSIIERNVISGYTLIVLLHNVKSLPRNVDDIVSDTEFWIMTL